MRENIKAALANHVAASANRIAPTHVERVIAAGRSLSNFVAARTKYRKEKKVSTWPGAKNPSTITGTNIQATPVLSLATAIELVAAAQTEEENKLIEKFDPLLDKIDRATTDVPIENTAMYRSTILAAVHADVEQRPLINFFVMAAQCAAAVKQYGHLPEFVKTVHKLTAADDEENLEPKPEDGPGDENKLLILTDPDAAKLVQRLYNDYVSEEDMSMLVQFILAFDKLLYKFRGGKPLSKEEVEELDDIEQAKQAKKKLRRAAKAKKSVAPPPEVDADDSSPDLDEVEV